MLVGYCDDAKVPSGGYWIIKNSWGTGRGYDNGNNGYYYIPYGDIEVHNDISAITGAGLLHRRHGHRHVERRIGHLVKRRAPIGNSGAYAWQNKETAATFSGTGGTVTISGTVIAHGMTINSAGYSFTGGSLTVTAGGITANESVTIQLGRLHRRPAILERGRRKDPDGQRPAAHDHQRFDLQRRGQHDRLGQHRRRRRAQRFGGAKPGGLIQSGTGAVTLEQYAGFRRQHHGECGRGALNISPTGGVSVAYSGASFGGGTINVNCSGAFTLAAAPRTSAAPSTCCKRARSISLPAAGVTGTFSGPINSGGLDCAKRSGHDRFSPARTTTRRQRRRSATAPCRRTSAPASLRRASSPSTAACCRATVHVTFNRSIGTSGGTFQWTSNGGGFAAGSGAMTVKVNNSTTHAAHLGNRQQQPDRGHAQVRLRDRGQRGHVPEQRRSQRRRPDDPGRRQRQLDRRLCRHVGRYFRFGRRGSCENGRRSLEVERQRHLFRHDDDRRRHSAGQRSARGFPRTVSSVSTAASCNSTTASSFTRGLGTSGATFQWGLGGGGFSAGASCAYGQRRRP